MGVYLGLVVMTWSRSQVFHAEAKLLALVLLCH